MLEAPTGRWAPPGCPATGNGGIQLLSKIVFVLLVCLETSMLSEMCFTSEEGVIIHGCGRSQYIAIHCLTFNFIASSSSVDFIFFNVLFSEEIIKLTTQHQTYKLAHTSIISSSHSVKIIV